MKIFSVNEVNNYLSSLIKNDILLQNINISGEISNFTHHKSGHMYFTLKDSSSQIKCVMFKGYNQNLDINLKTGLDVIVSGYVSIYEKGGNYQLYVRSIKKTGMGALYEKFNNLKDKLDKEGLFNKENKKMIPKYPESIGIITSQTGAAIKDILNVISRRYPLLKIIFYPSLVQGDMAESNIIEALITLDELNLDTIILARGGGSFEDLFVFNSENIARVIHSLKTPIITGVGHEIDFTIVDFVSDLRAPTPSSAAEVATPDILNLQNKLRYSFKEIEKSTLNKLSDIKSRINSLNLNLNYLNPLNKIIEETQYIDNLIYRIDIKNNLNKEQHKFEIYKEQLNSLNIENKLGIGYSILVREKDNNIVSSVKYINDQDTYNLKLKDGILNFKFNINMLEENKDE